MTIGTKTADDYKQYAKVLVYGKPGSRKTSYAATFPKPIFVDMERGTDTLTHLNMGGLAVERPSTVKQVYDILKEFPKSEFETIVIDTISRLQSFIMADVMQLAVKTNSSRDVYAPLFKEYRTVGAMLDGICYDLQMMDKNVILICHEKVVVDEETGRVIEVRPNLTPALANSVGGLISAVFYSEVKSGVSSAPATQTIYPNSFGKTFAKNRMNLSKPITNPNYENTFITNKG